MTEIQPEENNVTPDHDAVNHPRHYTSHPSGVECLQITRLLSFDAGNAVKYVWRTDLKNGLEDLDKARFYLADHIEHLGQYADMPTRAIILMDLVARAEAEIYGLDHYRPRFFRAMVFGDTAAAHDILNTYLEGIPQ